jgi:hypothetical protein
LQGRGHLHRNVLLDPFSRKFRHDTHPNLWMRLWRIQITWCGIEHALAHMIVTCVLGRTYFHAPRAEVRTTPVRDSNLHFCCFSTTLQPGTRVKICNKIVASRRTSCLDEIFTYVLAEVFCKM